ncbi:C4-dicarboxylate ABC transporter permease [Puniceibacterium antarcticum]|uniref:TRAP transporter small permease protein n=1 Tax=Puniceibacterium antarcticum TaxID=1206336 RepID=A0A2G8RKL8_9RHOB|nr:TRAP transporter small permease [Puniceibacterium antarcticum]PIL22043.1 C4-dicarboxylate ABC transporter permease [Puniceibacterium antarcticum]
MANVTDQSSDTLPRQPFDAIIVPIDALTRFANLVAGLALLMILGLITAEIISRNLLGSSLAFSWDYAAYAMGAAFMMGSADALRNGAHVRVTALLETVPHTASRVLEFGACLAGLATCAALAWALSEMALLSFQRGSTSATVMRTPLAWPQSLVAMGAIILTLQCLAQLLRLARGERLAEGAAIE